jgi:hypothetical protein
MFDACYLTKEVKNVILLVIKVANVNKLSYNSTYCQKATYGNDGSGNQLMSYVFLTINVHQN